MKLLFVNNQMPAFISTLGFVLIGRSWKYISLHQMNSINLEQVTITQISEQA